MRQRKKDGATTNDENELGRLVLTRPSSLLTSSFSAARAAPKVSALPPSAAAIRTVTFSSLADLKICKACSKRGVRKNNHMGGRERGYREAERFIEIYLDARRGDFRRLRNLLEIYGPVRGEQVLGTSCALGVRNIELRTQT